MKKLMLTCVCVCVLGSAGYAQLIVKNSSEETVMQVTDEGKVGIGSVTMTQLLNIENAIKIGSTTITEEGSIRFTGSDFEGYLNGQWVSLTAQPTYSSFLPSRVYWGRISMISKPTGSIQFTGAPANATHVLITASMHPNIESANPSEGAQYTLHLDKYPSGGNFSDFETNRNRVILLDSRTDVAVPIEPNASGSAVVELDASNRIGWKFTGDFAKLRSGSNVYIHRQGYFVTQ